MKKLKYSIYKVFNLYNVYQFISLKILKYIIEIKIKYYFEH